MISLGHLTALLVIAQGEPNVNEIAKTLELFDLTKITLTITIIGVSFFLNRLVVSVLDRLGEGQARRRLLFKKIQSFTKLGIFVASAYLVVMVFFGGDGDNKALLGLGGTLAVAVGFALKDTTSSLMAGVLILIDQPFQVGDRVQFGSTYGEVTEIGLRSVRIVTLDDNEVSIPNNKFLTEAVASANSGALDMMVVIKFHIAMTEDFELAKKLVYEACITSKYVYLHKPVVILLKDEVTGIAFSTAISCKAYVIDTRYESAFISDVTERAKRAFKEHLIHPPYTREYSVRSTEWDDFENAKAVHEILSDEDHIGTSQWLEGLREQQEEVIVSETPEEKLALVDLAVEVVHVVEQEEFLIASESEATDEEDDVDEVVSEDPPAPESNPDDEQLADAVDSASPVVTEQDEASGKPKQTPVAEDDEIELAKASIDSTTTEDDQSEQS